MAITSISLYDYNQLISYIPSVVSINYYLFVGKYRCGIMCIGLILTVYNNGIYKGFKKIKINKYVVIKLYIICIYEHFEKSILCKWDHYKKKIKYKGRINSNNDHIIFNKIVGT